LEAYFQVPVPACQATTTLEEAGVRTAEAGRMVGAGIAVEVGIVEADRTAGAGIVEADQMVGAGMAGAATVVAGKLRGYNV
jgi:hypothetical protein